MPATWQIFPGIYGDELTPVIATYSETIQTLARAKPVSFLEKRPAKQPEEKALTLVLKQAEVVIPMASMVDLEVERKRLQEEIEQIQSELARLEARLKDEAFLTKAPAVVVEKERQKLYGLADKLERLKQQILEL